MGQLVENWGKRGSHTGELWVARGPLGLPCVEAERLQGFVPESFWIRFWVHTVLHSNLGNDSEGSFSGGKSFLLGYTKACY